MFEFSGFKLEGIEFNYLEPVRNEHSIRNKGEFEISGLQSIGGSLYLQLLVSLECSTVDPIDS